MRLVVGPPLLTDQTLWLAEHCESVGTLRHPSQYRTPASPRLTPRRTEVARTPVCRTLPREELKAEVGVRELHDQLSRCLHHVGSGVDVVVTMRGRRVARLSMVDQVDALADLRGRGLVRDPQG